MLHLLKKTSIPTPVYSSFSPIPPDSPYLRLSGKLLTRDELSCSSEELNGLLNQSILQITPSIYKNSVQKFCYRCGADKPYLFGIFLHAACKKECTYCRNCIQMGRIIECECLYAGSSLVEWTKHDGPCKWDGELMLAQKKAAEEIRETIETKSELLVWAVCGAGKTEMLFPGLTRALELGLRICIATPRTDVVRELLPRLKNAFPLVTIQGLYGDSEEKHGDAQLIITTTHQLYRYASAFDVMVIDEIDAFPYHKNDTLKYAAKRASKPGGARIYLTATPRKKEKILVRRKKLKAVFIPSRFHGYPLPVPVFQLTPMLRKKLDKGGLPESLLQKIRQQQKGNRQLLLFTSTVSQALQLEELLAGKFTLTSVHAEDPERAQKVQDFRDKKLSILITTTILERGVTFPAVDVYVIDAGHEVFDEAALVQIAGRAGRSPDDPTGEVIFYHIGKANAMIDAREAIIQMNKRAKR
ncbi:DEAD/DEAH box helicase [Halobacillus sp. Marseille-Q1614]|uniref:DEAD/DEAH box helicase n=1 Tax=Halobacillus sp. Marseille-Q1614 TaxID=2709134 RepID=UPI00156F8CE2|nr:helicase-related protein [Halobacillus sp. Marseille-Q1614]